MAEKVKLCNWMDARKKIFKWFEFPDTGNVADDTIAVVDEEEEELDWEVGHEDIENGSKGSKKTNDEDDLVID